MSTHPSLKGPGQGKRHRNVLKKFERILKLKEQKRWTLEDGIYALPKVRSIKLRKKKAAKTVEAATPETAVAAGQQPAKPQAGAKPQVTAKPQTGQAKAAGSAQAKPAKS